jgi:hypothetical protein
MLLNYVQGQFYTYPYPSVWLTSGICWLPLHLTYCVCVCRHAYVLSVRMYVYMYVYIFACIMLYVCIYM